MHFLRICWGKLQFGVNSQGSYTSCDTHLCLAGMPFAARTWPTSLWEQGWEKLTQPGWRQNASSLNYHFMASPAPLINYTTPGERYFHHSPTSTDSVSVYLDAGVSPWQQWCEKSITEGETERGKLEVISAWVTPAVPETSSLIKGCMGVHCVYIRPKTATHLLEKNIWFIICISVSWWTKTHCFGLIKQNTIFIFDI